MNMKTIPYVVMTALLGFILGLPTATGAADFPAGSPKFAKSYAEAAKLAKESGKPLLLIFSAEWCGPCQRNLNEVYPSAAVKPYHDDFVWAYLDVDVKSNAEAAEAFGVGGIPHTQFVNAEGTKSLDQVIGSSSPKAFAKTLKKVAAKAQTGR